MQIIHIVPSLIVFEAIQDRRLLTTLKAYGLDTVAVADLLDKLIAMTI